ncbi:MAG: arginine--tRNA ligase [Methanobacteriota archaeon]|nr:MAG: arginine--tRNA ligase [Euryarchaeota archaeon]
MYPHQEAGEKVREMLEKVVTRLGVKPKEITLEKPPNPTFGDIATSICFSIAKTLRKNPMEIADKIAASISDIIRSEPLLERVEVASPGYLNFFYDNRVYLQKTLDIILSMGDNYGQFPQREEKIIVEHTSTNPTKPLHIGHARNAVLGDTTARLLKKLGYRVEVHNYIDDLGRQVAETIWGYENLGKTAGNKKFDHFLGEIYVEVHNLLEKQPKLDSEIKKFNEQMEKDPELLEKTRKICERCVEANLETAEKLGISYDLLVWESDILRSGVFEEAIKKLESSEWVEKPETGPLKGCLVLKLGKFFPNIKNPDKVLIRSDNTATYTVKDIAYQMWKFGLVESVLGVKPWKKRGLLTSSYDSSNQHNFGKAQIVVNVVGSEQDYPQLVVKKALEIIGYPHLAERSYHLSYEHVTLEEASLAGRKGSWLGHTTDEVVEEACKRAKQEVEKRRTDLDKEKANKISRSIGIGAIRYHLLKTSPDKKIVFRWEEALSFEGETAPYVQYAHARASSILAKAKDKQLPIPRHVDATLLTHPSEIKLVKKMAEYPTTLETAWKLIRPNHVTEFVYDLASMFNEFYRECPVLSATPEKLVSARLGVVQAVQHTLKSGLDVLGIDAPAEM